MNVNCETRLLYSLPLGTQLAVGGEQSAHGVEKPSFLFGTFHIQNGIKLLYSLTAKNNTSLVGFKDVKHLNVSLCSFFVCDASFVVLDLDIYELFCSYIHFLNMCSESDAYFRDSE